MTFPITGPFTKVENHKSLFTNFAYQNPNGITIRRTWYRQTKPYNLPLAWSYDYRQIERWSTNEPGLWSAGYDRANFDLTVKSHVYNKAYNRFKEAMGQTASLSVTLAERKQASEMLTRRLVQLTTFITQLKRLQFDDAARTLGITAPPLQKRRRSKGRMQPFEYAIWRDDNTGTVEQRARKFYLKRGPRVPSKIEPKQRGLIREDSHKAFANNYLEFHFGWSPLVSDIGNAIEVMQNRCPPFRVKASATHSTQYTTKVVPDETHLWAHNTMCTVRMGARVEVSNPNLYLANQMGFVNPMTVAWELVPYSFVVDWFVNVSDVLESATDFLGLNLISPYVTTMTRDKVNYTYYKKYSATETITQSGQFFGIVISRTPGAPSGPKLEIRPSWDLSWRRGLAAISLLLQKMR